MPSPHVNRLPKEEIVRSGSTGPKPGSRGKALVVDDDSSTIRLIQVMLEMEGFSVRTASNGKEAVECCEREPMDIVFMDLVLPVMDGIEAVRRIKAMSGDSFVPVIFLTGMSDDRTMLECIRAGGDDFVSKPISLMLLKARIAAIERVRDLQRRMALGGQPLRELLEREQQEQRLAERVFSRAINNRNVCADRLKVLQTAAATFGGDLVLSQRLPDGGLRVLVADITGHGLAATIGALPVAEAFHAMTLKGVGDTEVLREINGKLYGLLSPERFMSACMVTLAGSGRRLTWWNGGMPSAWLRTRDGLEELVSHALPLGVLPELSPGDLPRRRAVEADDGLVLFTDGLLEARDPDGQAFGAARLNAHLASWVHGESLFPALAAALEGHCADTPQPDDIALVELGMEPISIDRLPSRVGQVLGGGWTWAVELVSEERARAGSLTTLLKPLGLLSGMEPHAETLEALFVGLYGQVLAAVDARDRAVEPDVRPTGVGRISIDIQYSQLPDGGRLRLAMGGRDLGAEALSAVHLDPALEPLRQLCESLAYDPERERIEAVYRW